MVPHFFFQLPRQNKQKLMLFLFSFCLIASDFYAQQIADPFGIQKIKASYPVSKKELLIPVKSDNPPDSRLHYRLPMKQLKKWQEQYNPIISTRLDLPGGKTEDCLLTPYDFFEPEFKTYLVQNGISESVNLEKGSHFKGIFQGDRHGYVDLSIYQDELRAFMVDDDKNTVSIKSSGIVDNQLLCEARKDIPPSQPDELFSCHTDDILHYLESGREMTSRLRDNCNRVSISIRADYELFIRFGNNPQAVTNYITGLFNNINTVYKREDIQISLAEIFIHTSPDGFPNTSSSLALDHFRRNYQNYSGDIHLCLSGVLRNGRAALGGIAYINALCVKSYSYAYVNVNTVFQQYPQYSFDVYATAHELGHILGSRHTHACVWGPNKNQALDNCAKVEGSCLAGPRPSKGTIMSYCHTSGQPGIDLSLGFGDEPGDLIRSKVKTSSCLKSYTPDNKSFLSPDLHLSANVECSDGVYSHYYYDNNTIDPNDDILILSINNKGQDLGSVSDGSLKVIAHTTSLAGSGKGTSIQTSFMPAGHEYIASNKYWEIIPKKQPTNPVTIKAYFHPGDMADLFGSTLQPDLTKFSIYTIQSPGDPDPQSNHRYAAAKDFMEFTSTADKPEQKYTLMEEGGLFTIEINTNKINSLNAAKKSARDSKPETQSTTEFISVRARAFSNFQNITWVTSFELNSGYFIVEKSLNSTKFDSIGMVAATGVSQTQTNYSFNDFKLSRDVWYRITMVDKKGGKTSSPIVSLTSSYTASNRINLYPNPVGYSDLTVEYNQSAATPQQTNITVLDPMMVQVRTLNTLTYEGRNQIQIPFSDLSAPFYYIRLTSAGQTTTLKIVVKK